jgi:hypothetical protein
MMKTLVAAVSCSLALGLAARDARAQMGRESVQAVEVTATSTLKGKKERYAAWRAVDFDATPSDDMTVEYHATGWCEGKKNEGIGEALVLTGQPITATSILIAAGFWKSEKLFEKNNRPTRLTVVATTLDGQSLPFDVAVPADMQMATVDFGATMELSSVTIQFAEVAKGKINDTCISHLVVMRDGTPQVLFLESAGAIDDLATAVAMNDAGLSACDGTGSFKFPLQYKQLPDPTGETKAIKKKFKKLKDLIKACKKGQAPPPIGEFDFARVQSEAPGKVLVWGGNGNEYGAETYHYTRVVDDSAAWWQLTGVDY